MPFCPCGTQGRKDSVLVALKAASSGLVAHATTTVLTLCATRPKRRGWIAALRPPADGACPKCRARGRAFVRPPWLIEVAGRGARSTRSFWIIWFVFMTQVARGESGPGGPSRGGLSGLRSARPDEGRCEMTVRFPDEPAFQGRFAPVRLEGEIRGVEVTQGEIPASLRGLPRLHFPFHLARHRGNRKRSPRIQPQRDSRLSLRPTKYRRAFQARTKSSSRHRSQLPRRQKVSGHRSISEGHGTKNGRRL